MSSAPARRQRFQASGRGDGGGTQWALELVVVPVSGVDRAKAFHADRLGFAVDHDTRIGEGMRIVQLTPPGPAARS
jgi:hypothetical protein